ncbi:MAG: hypothetical protein JXO72_14655 [Vicinamibacteria bacterium]|nr:hypothetical protein [Vicinamibacteria bacterium]
MQQALKTGDHWIEKTSIAAMIRTPDQMIVGSLHINPRKRLKDELNIASDRFLAVTDARLYDTACRPLGEAAFLLVSSAHVITITPLEGVKPAPSSAWAALIGHE